MFRKTACAAMAFLLAVDFAPAQTGQSPGGQITGIPRSTPAVNFDNSARVHDLIRAGNLYLSLGDALALAIENNLDIELQRYLLPVGNTELERTRGGGVARGLNYTIFEAPAGVGGPLSPLVMNAATSGRATAGTSVTTNALGLAVLGEPQTNLSIQGTVPQSNGTPVPIFDPALVGQVNWTHASSP